MYGDAGDTHQFEIWKYYQLTGKAHAKVLQNLRVRHLHALQLVGCHSNAGGAVAVAARSHQS